jgi:catechol 2,3-dioxygenase-like lactoylglutathione lyase family enzyme
MKLNHTNVPVTDVDAASEFLEQYFGFQHVGGEGNVVVLLGQDDFVLGLTPTDAETTVPKSLHIGFFVDSRDTVEETHHRLAEDGFDVGSLAERHHLYDFYVEAPGGLTIEIGARLNG